jgi:ribonuclease VapC
MKPEPSTRIRWSPALIGALATGFFVLSAAFGMAMVSPPGGRIASTVVGRFPPVHVDGRIAFYQVCENVMQLNIKNDEAYRLARELATHTGESLTDAVTTALRERLERERTRASEKPATKSERLKRLEELARRFDELPVLDADLMVVDTSVLVAIVRHEPERRRFLKLMADAEVLRIASVTWMEARMVVFARLGERGLGILIAILESAGVEVVPVGGELADSAFAAFRRFGKGRHAARLNFGDCFAYALAKSSDMPLLFKGDDFSKTDVKSAAGR